MQEQGRIVAGLDGSVEALAAVRIALAEAALRGSRVEVVRAFLPPDHTGSVHYCAFAAPTLDQLTASIERSGRRWVDGIAAAGGGALATVPVDVVAQPGRPAKVLVERALGADLLVLGRRRAAGTRPGSVGRYCMLHAPCPVTIVRYGDPRDGVARGLAGAARS
ncbi:universal stress protein [Pseudonocardia sp. GCM10023141]|uniref:universal stress protein n=1 Tax=Pseudonocardia sp. GCM10023141 TaxID=3252653 RepID=UPI00361FFD7B